MIASGASYHTGRVPHVTNDHHPLRSEKAVFSGRWSLVRGLYVRRPMPGKVVCSTRLVASHGGL